MGGNMKTDEETALWSVIPKQQLATPRSIMVLAVTVLYEYEENISTILRNPKPRPVTQGSILALPVAVLVALPLAHSLCVYSHIPACDIRINPGQLEGVHYMHHYRCRVDSFLCDPGSSVFISPPIK